MRLLLFEGSLTAPAVLCNAYNLPMSMVVLFPVKNN
jgi:hypothetical protein